jgi:GNAT superfamily N-acetyltransferase
MKTVLHFHERYSDVPAFSRAIIYTGLGLSHGCMRGIANKTDCPTVVAYLWGNPVPIGWAVMVPACKAWKNFPQIMVYVHPHYRRQGVGRRLSRKLLTGTKLWGKNIYTGAGTKKAIRFFEAVGFETRHNKQKHK